jgi:hypothetical protein
MTHIRAHTAAKEINGRDDFLWQPETVELSETPDSFEGRSDSFFQSYKQFDEVRTLGQVNRVACSCLGFCGVWPLGLLKEVQAISGRLHFWTSRPRYMSCLGFVACGHLAC